MTAGIAPKISGNLPLQSASSVRDLPHIKGQALADPDFDQPGKIDMLLGEDVLSDILLTGGPKGAATLTESVFGGAIRGPFVPDQIRPSGAAAAAHLACESVVQPDQDTTDALTKFWESQEPGKPASALSPEDSRIHIHYKRPIPLYPLQVDIV